MTSKTSKTRKMRKTQNNITKCNKNAMKGLQLKCRMKTCRASKYKSVYGSTGGSIRSNRRLFH